MVGTAMMREVGKKQQWAKKMQREKKECGVGGTAQGSEKWILQWPAGWEVQWQGEGRRRYKDLCMGSIAAEKKGMQPNTDSWRLSFAAQLFELQILAIDNYYVAVTTIT